MAEEFLRSIYKKISLLVMIVQDEDPGAVGLALQINRDILEYSGPDAVFIRTIFNPPPSAAGTQAFIDDPSPANFTKYMFFRDLYPKAQLLLTNRIPELFTIGFSSDYLAIYLSAIEMWRLEKAVTEIRSARNAVLNEIVVQMVENEEKVFAEGREELKREFEEYVHANHPWTSLYVQFSKNHVLDPRCSYENRLYAATKEKNVKYIMPFFPQRMIVVPALVLRQVLLADEGVSFVHNEIFRYAAVVVLENLETIVASEAARVQAIVAMTVLGGTNSIRVGAVVRKVALHCLDLLTRGLKSAHTVVGTVSEFVRTRYDAEIHTDFVLGIKGWHTPSADDDEMEVRYETVSHCEYISGIATSLSDIEEYVIN